MFEIDQHFLQIYDPNEFLYTCPGQILNVHDKIQAYASFHALKVLFSEITPSNFWLPAACGGAALEANITLLLLVPMSFTQNLLLSFYTFIITKNFLSLALALLSISIA